MNCWLFQLFDCSIVTLLHCYIVTLLNLCVSLGLLRGSLWLKKETHSNVTYSLKFGYLCTVIVVWKGSLVPGSQFPVPSSQTERNKILNFGILESGILEFWRLTTSLLTAEQLANNRINGKRRRSFASLRRGWPVLTAGEWMCKHAGHCRYARELICKTTTGDNNFALAA